MRIRVIYKSRRNTKKVAESIAGALGVKAETIESVKDLENADVLFLGFGIYGGSAPKEVHEFINNNDFNEVKRVVLFTTSAIGTDQTNDIKALLKEKGVVVSDEVFSAKGRFLWKNWKEPGREALKSAVQFAERIGEAL